MQGKLIDLGSDNVVRSPALVDQSLKTMFTPNNVFVLISAPSRFEKSPNLYMIETFCSIPTRANGSQHADRDGTAAQHRISKHLLIFNLTDFVYKRFGSYPIIFLDLKVDNQPIKDYADAFTFLESKINTNFKEDSYLVRNLSGDDKEPFSLWISNFRYVSSPDKVMFNSLVKLGEYLYNYCKLGRTGTVPIVPVVSID